MSTAGPQSGTVPAQYVPLDLNLGSAQLSINRDLLSSVCIAGLQRQDKMPENISNKISDRIPKNISNRMSDRIPENMPNKIP